MVAVLQGPRRVFVHWDLGGPRSREVAREVGPEAQWMLRILDLSTGTSRSVPISREEGSSYVDVAPGRTYGFELAAKAGDRWRTVCRTERLEVPPSVRAEKGSAAPDEEAPPGLSIESTPLHVGSSFSGHPPAR
jgi:hypothetical protein